MLEESDALAVRQREEPVVVHDGVHVLDPQRVHVAVKHDVLALALVSRLVDVAEDVRQQSVSPVSRGRVQNAVQFNNTAVLGVNHKLFGVHTKSSE